MKRRRLLWLVSVSIGLVTLTWIGLTQITLRALDEPGRAETYLATKAKRMVVGREARHISRAQPADMAQSVTIGQMQFRARCAACHGIDGRTPTEIGAAMYPRASDLGSAEVQEWSDGELFWLIRNGIRLTGMPGFERHLSEAETWPLVDFIRSLAFSNRTGESSEAEIGPSPSGQASRARGSKFELTKR